MKLRYRRMLQGMGAAGPADWSVYVLRCSDGSLYTGVAKDVDARLQRHNSGKGAAYTRSRRPVELVSFAEGFTRSEALMREAWVKSLPAQRKASALGLAGPKAGSYNKTGMPKRKKEPGSKRAKPAAKKRPSSAQPDPEWDHLQERFQSISADFGRLAEIIDDEKPPS